jgi:hypothetical protein
MKKISPIIASASLRPPGVHRPTQPGEVLYLASEKAKELIKAGVAIPAKRAPEFAVRRPKENR